MAIDQSIFLAILENGKTTFRNLQETSKISPNTLKKHLNELKARRLVREEGRFGWRWGKRLEYSLTEKGRRLCFGVALGSIDEGLRTINAIATEKLNRPQELAMFRKEARHVVCTLAADENVSLEKRIRRTQATRDAYFGSFRKALRAMHDIALKLGPPAVSAALMGDVFILVTEKGVINAVSEDEILKHPEIPVISM